MLQCSLANLCKIASFFHYPQLVALQGGGDDHRTAYAKAKRFKKLARLLNSPAAKAALVRLRLGCLVMLAFTAVVQLVVFIVDRSFYNSLSA